MYVDDELIILSDPPKEYETTNSVEEINNEVSEYKNKLFQAEKSNKTIDEYFNDYINLRKKLLYKITNTDIKQLINTHKEELDLIFNHCTHDDVKNLLQQRHRWIEKICSNNASFKKICIVDNCINYRSYGSDYCLNHMLKDKNQRLFIKCEICSRPYVKNRTCIFCASNRKE